MRLNLIHLRNRLLASPAFQRRAMAVPFVRGVARRRAGGLFDIVAGFVHAQVLAAAIRLDLLTLLRDAAMTPAEIAARLDLPEKSARALLAACAGLKLAERLGADRYTLGPQGAALLGNPGVAEMIAHHDRLYADLADPVALLRRGGGGGALADFWRYADGGDADAVSDYSRLMAASQPLVAEQILDAWRFERHRAVMDVGGGEGAFLRAVAARHPALALTLFDLPAVAERARARLPGVECIGGSFLTDPLPQARDLVTLVRILHDHDDAPAQALLDAIARALPAGGTLLIAEPMAETPGAESVGSYFDMYLLAMGSGRPRTPDEIGAMLRRAGFAAWRSIKTRNPLTTSLIAATR
jgi:demethylspheroidene O-methyltransferase